MEELANFINCVGCNRSHADWLIIDCLHSVCQCCVARQHYKNRQLDQLVLSDELDKIQLTKQLMLDQPIECPSCQRPVSAGQACENFLLLLAGPPAQRFCNQEVCIQVNTHAEAEPAVEFCLGCDRYNCYVYQTGHLCMPDLSANSHITLPVNRPPLADWDGPACQHSATQRWPIQRLCLRCDSLLCEDCANYEHDRSHADRIVPVTEPAAWARLLARLRAVGDLTANQVRELKTGCSQAQSAIGGLDANFKQAVDQWQDMKTVISSDYFLKASDQLRMELYKAFTDEKLKLSQSDETQCDQALRCGRLADLFEAVLAEARESLSRPVGSSVGDSGSGGALPPPASAEAVTLALRYCLTELDDTGLGGGAGTGGSIETAGSDDNAEDCVVDVSSTLDGARLKFDETACRIELKKWSTITTYDLDDDDTNANQPESADPTDSAAAAAVPQSVPVTQQPCDICGSSGDDASGRKLFVCSACQLPLHAACQPLFNDSCADSSGLCVLCDINNESPDVESGKVRRVLAWLLLARPHPRLTKLAQRIAKAARPIGLAGLSEEIRLALAKLHDPTRSAQLCAQLKQLGVATA
ncbi:hypothetical protein BOX15_Mlig016143g2 [Macrostomum lignano]|uniref:Uncharacterized protein n=1 Tax=Macrostomum lignano TaxID=282301 RepID=A0A267GUJ8_9PLAT|nr:hypothetical protein BOX15_Mlig016143g2 [Macrostomum lignano]